MTSDTVTKTMKSVLTMMKIGNPCHIHIFTNDVVEIIFCSKFCIWSIVTDKNKTTGGLWPAVFKVINKCGRHFGKEEKFLALSGF